MSMSPAPAGRSVAPSSSNRRFSQPAPRVPTQFNAASNGQLTDEQIEFVVGLWRARVPAAEIAQVMQWMREGRDTSSQRLVGTDAEVDVRPGMALSYNSIYS